MGDQTDMVIDDWHAAGRPSAEEAARRAGEPTGDDWDNACAEHNGSLSAADIAAANFERARSMKRKDPLHADCPGKAAFDAELGVVCYCGTVLGFPPDAVMPDLAMPLSQTTADARLAQPLVVQEETRKVTSVNGMASAVHPADPILASLDVIDPTAPYDSKMVEEHLLDAMARLERGAHYERFCAEDYADKVLKYEAAHARALLEAANHGGAADIRAARAAVTCETEYIQRMIAKMKLDAVKANMHSLRSIMSGYQSVASSIRAAYSGGGSNGSKPNF